MPKKQPAARPPLAEAVFEANLHSLMWAGWACHWQSGGHAVRVEVCGGGLIPVRLDLDTSGIPVLTVTREGNNPEWRFADPLAAVSRFLALHRAGLQHTRDRQPGDAGAAYYLDREPGTGD